MPLISQVIFGINNNVFSVNNPLVNAKIHKVVIHVWINTIMIQLTKVVLLVLKDALNVVNPLN